MKQPYHIYVLVNPEIDHYFYVGMTTNPIQRIEAHVKNLDYYNRPKRDYVKSMQCEPKMIILETVSEKMEARLAERKWYFHYKNLGHTLFNNEKHLRTAADKQKIYGHLITGLP